MACSSCGAVHFVLSMQDEHDVHRPGKLGVGPASQSCMTCLTLRLQVQAQQAHPTLIRHASLPTALPDEHAHHA